MPPTGGSWNFEGYLKDEQHLAALLFCRDWPLGGPAFTPPDILQALGKKAASHAIAVMEEGLSTTFCDNLGRGAFRGADHCQTGGISRAGLIIEEFDTELAFLRCRQHTRLRSHKDVAGGRDGLVGAPSDAKDLVKVISQRTILKPGARLIAHFELKLSNLKVARVVFEIGLTHNAAELREAFRPQRHIRDVRAYG
jgi:hypothetical protein